MEKKELVTLFMESPVYFDLRVEERLALLRDHIRRFVTRSRQSGLLTRVKVDPVDPAAGGAPPSVVTEGRLSARLVVGYLKPAPASGGILK
jgi:hypothetical protein